MSNLGQIIRAVQREAAALPTEALRHDIEVSLGALDASIAQLHSIRPGTGRVEEQISATSEVWVAALTTALYVRELTTRPADVTAVVTSLN